MNGAEPEPCPHCGKKMHRLDVHEPACAKVPADVDEVFMEESVTLAELADRYNVSSNFIGKSLRRRGLTKKEIYEHLSETASERGNPAPRTLRGIDSVRRPDYNAKCTACGLILFNDPANIPRFLRPEWHVNMGGYCEECLTPEGGVYWERWRPGMNGNQ